MRERPVVFGPDDGLIGVLTEPAPARRRASGPTLLAWNVGINHRTGPHRIFVDLARDLAQRGFASLRFDLSGRGDSEPRKDASSEMERDMEDLREAMRLVSSRGGARFVALGFCSSVDAAHKLALVDDRVVGAVFVEGYAHVTPGFYLHYPLRLLDRARWRRVIARNLPARASRWPLVNRLARIPLAVPGDAQVYVRDYPPPEKLRRDYACLAERGTRMLFVYAGADGSYNHRSQLFEFGCSPALASRVDLEFYPRADHTFYRMEDRARLVSRIGGWMEETYS